jgi:hypothetical protein
VSAVQHGGEGAERALDPAIIVDRASGLGDHQFVAITQEPSDAGVVHAA